MNYEAKLADIIDSLPDVEGGFLYSPETGIYGNRAAILADDTGLTQIGQKLAKISAMLSIHYSNIGNFRVTFKDLILFGMTLDNGHWLLLFCRPTLSPSMLNMTVKLALNVDTDEEEASTAESSPEPVTQAAELEAEESAADLLQQLLLPTSELSKPLTAIQDELARFIGPVAHLVMEEGVKQWVAAGSPTPANLQELGTILLKDIDDEDDRETFSKNFTTLYTED